MHEKDPMHEKNPPKGSLIKQGYEPPMLRCYGTLHDITLMIGPVGQMDGGVAGGNHTHF
jgi:hypothetical protein